MDLTQDEQRPARTRRGPGPWARFLRHRLACGGAVFLGVIILAALLAPWMGRHDPFHTELERLNQAPDAVHWLGTDLIGRDVWSRVIHGSRTSLTVGILAVALSTLIGSLLGALAGYSGGPVDQAVMRATEVMMSIPVLLMVMLFVSLLGPSLASVTLVIGLLGWSSTCRVVRGEVLVLREKEFIVAARSLGNGHARVILRHILPNTVGPLSVIATFGFANAILLEAALSFLGLGVPPPTPSWGGMLNEAQSPTVLAGMPWLWMAPGAAIALTVLAVNFIGDGLRDSADVRSL